MVWAAPIGLRFKRQGYEFDSGPSWGCQTTVDGGEAGVMRLSARSDYNFIGNCKALHIEHTIDPTRLFAVYSFETMFMGQNHTGLFCWCGISSETCHYNAVELIINWSTTINPTRYFDDSSGKHQNSLSQSHPIDAGNLLPCQFSGLLSGCSSPSSPNPVRHLLNVLEEDVFSGSQG